MKVTIIFETGVDRDVLLRLTSELAESQGVRKEVTIDQISGVKIEVCDDIRPIEIWEADA